MSFSSKWVPSPRIISSEPVCPPQVPSMAQQNGPPVSTEGTLYDGTTPDGAHAVGTAAMRFVASRRASRRTKQMPGDVTTRSAASPAPRARFRGSSLHGSQQNGPPVSTAGTLHDGTTPVGAHAVGTAAMRFVASSRASRRTKQTNKLILTGDMRRVPARRAACHGAPEKMVYPLLRIAVDRKGTVS